MHVFVGQLPLHQTFTNVTCVCCYSVTLRQTFTNVTYMCFYSVITSVRPLPTLYACIVTPLPPLRTNVACMNCYFLLLCYPPPPFAEPTLSAVTSPSDFYQRYMHLCYSITRLCAGVETFTNVICWYCYSFLLYS